VKEKFTTNCGKAPDLSMRRLLSHTVRCSNAGAHRTGSSDFPRERSTFLHLTDAPHRCGPLCRGLSEVVRTKRVRAAGVEIPNSSKMGAT
jgi:hypothetical protein